MEAMDAVRVAFEDVYNGWCRDADKLRNEIEALKRASVLLPESVLLPHIHARGAELVRLQSCMIECKAAMLQAVVNMS